MKKHLIVAGLAGVLGSIGLLGGVASAAVPVVPVSPTKAVLVAPAFFGPTPFNLVKGVPVNPAGGTPNACLRRPTTPDTVPLVVAERYVRSLSLSNPIVASASRLAVISYAGWCP